MKNMMFITIVISFISVFAQADSTEVEALSTGDNLQCPEDFNPRDAIKEFPITDTHSRGEFESEIKSSRKRACYIPNSSKGSRVSYTKVSMDKIPVGCSVSYDIKIETSQAMPVVGKLNRIQKSSKMVSFTVQKIDDEEVLWGFGDQLTSQKAVDYSERRNSVSGPIHYSDHKFSIQTSYSHAQRSTQRGWKSFLPGKIEEAESQLGVDCYFTQERNQITLKRERQNTSRRCEVKFIRTQGGLENIPSGRPTCNTTQGELFSPCQCLSNSNAHGIRM